MTTPIDTLLAVCRNATQGTLEITKYSEEHRSEYEVWTQDEERQMCGCNDERDARFITTFAPETVERMLELLKNTAEAMPDVCIKFSADEPCPGCKLGVLIESFLSSLSKEATE